MPSTPLESHRRMAFMMLDTDVVTVSLSNVYRVLSDIDMPRMDGIQLVGQGRDIRPRRCWLVSRASCPPTSSHRCHEAERSSRHFPRIRCNCDERQQAIAFARTTGPARTSHAVWRKLRESADCLSVRTQRNRRQPPDPARPASLQPATRDRRRLGGEKVTEQSQNSKDGSHYIE
jgi:CheY-like chemotaxis protein